MQRAAAWEAEAIRQSAVAAVRKAWVDLRAAREDLERVQTQVVAQAEANDALAAASLDAGVLDKGAALAHTVRALDARLAESAAAAAEVRAGLELERAAGGRLGSVPGAVDRARPEPEGRP